MDVDILDVFAIVRFLLFFVIVLVLCTVEILAHDINDNGEDNKIRGCWGGEINKMELRGENKIISIKI